MDNRKVEILFCGDLAPIGINERLLLDGIDLFFDIRLELLKADIAFVNLEAPLTNSDNKITKNGPCLKANPKVITNIKKAGFNLLGLANNHIMDYGKQGLTDTIQSCKQEDIDTIGAGDNLKESHREILLKALKDKI